MNAKQRERIDAFIASGARSKRSASGATIARQGGGFQTLIDARGERTPAGAYYEAQSGEALSIGGFDST